MNRVVIIGNGFDLAHGLETFYSDFMMNFLKDALIQAYSKSPSENELIKIEVAGKFHNTPALNEYLTKFSSLRELLNSPHISLSFNSKKNFNQFKISSKSRFVSRILSKYDNPNWVDIESEYFTYLHETATGNAKNKVELIEELNHDLKIVSNYLQKYLMKTEEEFDFKAIYDLDPEFEDKITKLIFNRIIFSSGTVGQKYKTLIVNYNYTNTVSRYINRNPYDYEVESINLHGSVESQDIIFGYGHVDNPAYKQLKDSGNDEFLKGLKLFNYHKESNYRKLSDFIHKDEYDIYVVGHSCGESDGTTMRRFFDNKNCKRINICHIGIDEYQAKTMSIIRHCNSEEVHDKIRPFTPELQFPSLPRERK